MNERDNYQLPEPHINFDRNVEGEEQHNNIQNVTESMHEVIQVIHRQSTTGEPPRYYVDDIDNERMVEVSMDREWQNMVLMGIGKERRHLEKQGVVFDFRTKGGDTK